MILLINHIQTFLEDNKTNVLIGVDLNTRSEKIGSDPNMRCKRLDKFKAGDVVFEMMNELDVININNGISTI